MKPDKLRVLVKNAAAKIYYPHCLQYIENNMHEDFHQLARATLVYYLPSHIADLNTREERREAINSIPDIADPIHTKEFIVNGVKALWKKDKRAQLNGKTSLRNRG